jgi:hypothetical protein
VRFDDGQDALGTRGSCRGDLSGFRGTFDEPTRIPEEDRVEAPLPSERLGIDSGEFEIEEQLSGAISDREEVTVLEPPAEPSVEVAEQTWVFEKPADRQAVLAGLVKWRESSVVAVRPRSPTPPRQVAAIDPRAWRELRMAPLLDGVPNEALRDAVLSAELRVVRCEPDDLVEMGGSVALVCSGRVTLARFSSDVLREERRAQLKRDQLRGTPEHARALTSEAARRRAVGPLPARAEQNLRRYAAGEVVELDSKLAGDSVLACYAVAPAKLIVIARRRIEMWKRLFPFVADRFGAKTQPAGALRDAATRVVPSRAAWWPDLLLALVWLASYGWAMRALHGSGRFAGWLSLGAGLMAAALAARLIGRLVRQALIGLARAASQLERGLTGRLERLREEFPSVRAADRWLEERRCGLARPAMVTRSGGLRALVALVEDRLARRRQQRALERALVRAGLGDEAGHARVVVARLAERLAVLERRRRLFPQLSALFAPSQLMRIGLLAALATASALHILVALG